MLSSLVWSMPLGVKVTSVSPNTGPTAGGTAITVTGSGFLPGATVALSGVPCTSVVVVDSYTITCVTGAGTVGAKTCAVTNTSGQQGLLLNAFTYTSAAPSLTSLNNTQTDSAGGDTFIVATGTTLSTITACQFSRDGGSTWVAGTLGALTSTTAQLIPPAMAATASGLVRVSGPGGTSNTLAIEFWAPTDDANCTLLFDAKYSAYNATSGVWTPRYSIVAGSSANVSNYLAAKHPSDGSGGVYFDGDATTEGGMVSNGTVWTSYLGPLTGGVQHPGSAFTVHSSQTTLTDTLANFMAAPYTAATVFGNASQGTIGIDNFVLSNDGQHYLAGHVYGNDAYKLLKVQMPTTGLHACVLRWSASAGAGGVVQLSLDGALSGGGYDSTTVTGNGSTADAYLSSLTLGDRYSSGSASTQYFKGSLSAFGALKDIASDTFVTKFAKWKLARFGT